MTEPSSPENASREAIFEKAIRAVIDASGAYLPPDGISKDEFINRVLGATDNSEVFHALNIRAQQMRIPYCCDWPNEPFKFHDEPGEHDPCYVIMPGGAMLPLNHHAGEGVDIARAKFIVAACNAALSHDFPREIVAEAMQDAWNTICSDTGCHPLDIEQRGKKLFFSPGHWTDLIALFLGGHPAFTSPEHQSAPAYAATHNSGEGDPSVMPDYAGADTAIQPQPSAERCDRCGSSGDVFVLCAGCHSPLPRPAIQPQRMREQIIEACAKIAEPWVGFWPQDDATATDKAIIEVRTEIAKKIRELAHTRPDDPPQQMPDSLREVLKQHWLTAIHCDHKDGTDRPGCYCATWYCEPQPTVGAAVDKWIDHVIEQLSLTRPDAPPQCAPDREALVRAIQLSYARKDLEPTSATTLALYREDAENAADAVLALTRPDLSPAEKTDGSQS